MRPGHPDVDASRGLAEDGASDLSAARSRVRYVVEDAFGAGFDVREDMSVTDRSTAGSIAQRAIRQSQAQTYADDIRQRAAQVVALDQQVAGRVTAAVAGIRDTFPPEPNPDEPRPKPKVQAVDNHTFKQEPPPAGSYPTNEVVAEAAAVDGNHVVLRRGYYDERTQQGFGWDKAFWRHHVTNPNVFKDRSHTVDRSVAKTELWSTKCRLIVFTARKDRLESLTARTLVRA